MIFSSIYCASHQNKRLSQTLCSFAHSLIQPPQLQTLNPTPKHLSIRNPHQKCYSIIQQMSFTSSHATDTNQSTIQSTWIDKYLPTSARPYAYLARLDKPIGIWLLAWPCMWFSFINTMLTAIAQSHLNQCISFWATTILCHDCAAVHLAATHTSNCLLISRIGSLEDYHKGSSRSYQDEDDPSDGVSRERAFIQERSITMAGAQGHLPDLKMIALFGCGSLLLRGAGCTINDIVDKTADEKVERTRLRPIASGLITKFQGASFAASQFLLGLGVLLQLNDYSQVLGASSLPLVVTYPFMKRFTYWPQAHLGLTYSWGALLGWSAVKGSLDPIIVLPLYLSGVFWTLVYDTIYAHQDKQDDKKVGVKSTALLFEDRTKYWVSGFGSACISSLLLSGYNAEIGWPFYVFVTAASGQLAWQIWTVDLSRPADCNKKFLSNKWFGGIVFSGILISKLSS